MRYVFFIAVFALISCTKESEKIVGIWNATRAEWDGGGNGFSSGEYVFNFTDNGRIIINGLDRYSYVVKDDHHILINGNEYQYDLQRKSLKIFYWYMQLDPESFPNIVLYFSK